MGTRFFEGALGPASSRLAISGEVADEGWGKADCSEHSEMPELLRK